MPKEQYETFSFFRKKDRQTKILENYSSEKRTEILYKLEVLAALAHSVCKDANTVVELNNPGGGWYWNFVDNVIRIDPNDLLSKSMNYLRFVVAHEGGHRRISRVSEIVPNEVWMQNGFPFMSNAIEDPRDNSFLAEAYPVIGDYMLESYDEDFSELEQKLTSDIAELVDETKQKLGRVPRYLLAGFEYIYQWFIEMKTGEESVELREYLPDEVKAVVLNTLPHARHSWRHYPSIEEVESEELIVAYAKASYEINRDFVWPEFKKLIEMDQSDQQVEEKLKDMKKDKKAGSSDGGIPGGLNNQLTDEEKKELSDALDGKSTPKNNTSKNGGTSEKGESPANNNNSQSSQGYSGGKESAQNKDQSQNSSSKENLNTDFRDDFGEAESVDMEGLSSELKEKLKEYIDSLPDNEKAELAARAKESLHEFDVKLNEKFGGKFADNPEKRFLRGEVAVTEDQQPNSKPSTLNSEQLVQLQIFEQKLREATEFDKNLYEKYLKELLSLINRLESKLRDVFQERRDSELEVGLRQGKRLNINTAIQEEARDIPVEESRAWESIRLPDENDYAISILVDLSGSMGGEKILETFKAMIVLAEVLNRLSIRIEILGFNNSLFEYKVFDHPMNDEIRQKMSDMPSSTGGGTDDGKALSQTSNRLGLEEAEQKFIFVLSDGGSGSSGEFELSKVVSKIMTSTDQKLIGLGVGPGTEFVANYYPFNLANIRVEELVEVLGELILDVIINYHQYQ